MPDTNSISSTNVVALQIQRCARNLLAFCFIMLLSVVMCESAFALRNLDSAVFYTKKGVSLEKQLESLGINRLDAKDAIEELANVYDVDKIPVGQHVKVNYEIMDAEGKEIRFSSMEIRLSSIQKIQVSRIDRGVFFAHIFESIEQPKLVYVEATVGSTLFSVVRTAGISHEMFNEFVKAYSYDVDFQRDVSPGDKIEVLYEAVYDDDGNLLIDGDILYISLSIRKGRFTLFNYATPDGKREYYRSNGEIAKRSLLLTPVNGARISSGYGKRKHPVLGYSKMHKGVDFAAPKGTPIYAAGSGVITEILRKGSYGKYIRLHHNASYDTAYAHMNGFARGLKRGMRVHQGQVIGYVGATGRATGPHLHYEVLEKGKQVNPLKVSVASNFALTGKEKKIFMKYKDYLLGSVARLSKLSRKNGA